MSNAIFIDYFPDPMGKEMEKLKLLLSIFRDGTGMLSQKQGEHYPTFPGWRDFERITSVLVDGEGGEDKDVYDVFVNSDTPNVNYGYSCKMKESLRTDVENKGRLYIEATNSDKRLWEGLIQQGINSENITDFNGLDVGISLINTINSWFDDVKHDSTKKGRRRVYIDKSPLLHLAYDRKSVRFQLFCLEHHLLTIEQAESCTWVTEINRTKALRSDGTIAFEWYRSSGSQVKWYPKLEEALWKSEIFTLEELPDLSNEKNILISKAEIYFEEKWHLANIM